LTRRFNNNFYLNVPEFQSESYTELSFESEFKQLLGTNMSLEDKLTTQKGKDELKNFVKVKMELLNNWIIIMKRELESSLEYLTNLYEVKNLK